MRHVFSSFFTLIFFYFFHFYYYSYTPGVSSEYLAVLDETLPHLLDTLRPDLVLYDAGVDPHVKDDLGIVKIGGVGIVEVVEVCNVFKKENPPIFYKKCATSRIT